MKPKYLLIVSLSTILMSITLVIAATNLFAKTRTWTDKTGQHKIQAELVAVQDGVAKLQKKDGTIIEVPLEKLSKADQRWIEKNQNEPDEAPEDQSLTSALANVNADSRDWPRWRGQNNDGISTETGLLKS